MTRAERQALPPDEHAVWCAVYGATFVAEMRESMCDAGTADNVSATMADIAVAAYRLGNENEGDVEP